MLISGTHIVIFLNLQWFMWAHYLLFHKGLCPERDISNWLSWLYYSCCRYQSHQKRCMQLMTHCQHRVLQRTMSLASSSLWKLESLPRQTLMTTQDLTSCYWAWDLMGTVHHSSPIILLFMWKKSGLLPSQTHQNHHRRESPLHYQLYRLLQIFSLLLMERGKQRWWPKFLGRSCHLVSSLHRAPALQMGSSFGLLIKVLHQSFRHRHYWSGTT